MKEKSAGNSMVEFALMLPLLLLMLFGILEFARFMQAFLTVQHAAREGARYAVTGRSVTGIVADRPASIVYVTRKSAAGLRIAPRVDTPYQELYSTVPSDLDVWVNPMDGGVASGAITVTVTYNFEPLAPVNFKIAGQSITIMPDLLTVVGKAVMINERIDYVTPMVEGTLPVGTPLPTPSLPPPVTPTWTATLDPAFTPPPTATPTFTPSATPTATPTATATATPPPTVTPTATATLIPTITPTSFCDLSATPLELDGDEKIAMDITNNGANGAEIISISVVWPEANEELKDVKLGDPKIWDEKDKTSPTFINSKWKGQAADRTINSGDTQTLKIKFKSEPIQPGPYTVIVTFEGGCAVTGSIP